MYKHGVAKFIALTGPDYNCNLHSISYCEQSILDFKCVYDTFTLIVTAFMLSKVISGKSTMTTDVDRCGTGIFIQC